MKQIANILVAFAWILIPAVLLYAALAVDNLPAWHRVADRGSKRVAR